MYRSGELAGQRCEPRYSDRGQDADSIGVGTVEVDLESGPRDKWVTCETSHDGPWQDGREGTRRSAH